MKHENSLRKTDFITTQAEPQKGLARVKGNQWKCSIVGQIKGECRIRKQEKALGGGKKKSMSIYLQFVNYNHMDMPIRAVVQSAPPHGSGVGDGKVWGDFQGEKQICKSGQAKREADVIV